MHRALEDLRGRLAWKACVEGLRGRRSDVSVLGRGTGRLAQAAAASTRPGMKRRAQTAKANPERGDRAAGRAELGEPGHRRSQTGRNP